MVSNSAHGGRVDQDNIVPRGRQDGTCPILDHDFGNSSSVKPFNCRLRRAVAPEGCFIIQTWQNNVGELKEAG